MPYFYAVDLMWRCGSTDTICGHAPRRTEGAAEEADPQERRSCPLYADHVDGYGVDFFRMICERNLEGIVAKHRASPYSSAAKWIKIKNPAYTKTERRHELFEKSTRRRTIAPARTGVGEVGSVRHLEERE